MQQEGYQHGTLHIFNISYAFFLSHMMNRKTIYEGNNEAKAKLLEKSRDAAIQRRIGAESGR